jgi:AcrR family transcriptional regulator
MPEIKNIKQSAINAAIELITEAGPDNVTLQKTADESGMDLAFIKRLFPNKTELLLSVLSYTCGNSANDFQAIVQSNMPFESKIVEFIQRSANDMPVLNESLISEIISSGKKYEKAVSDIMNESTEAFLDLYDQGRENGSISLSLSAKDFLFYIDFISTAFLQLDAIYSDDKSYPELIALIGDLLVHGLAGKRGKISI